MNSFPQYGNLALHAEIVRHLMIESMQQVVPDVNVDVQYSISDLWAKNAEVVIDQEGRLVVWRPVKVQRIEDKAAKEAAMLLATSARYAGNSVANGKHPRPVRPLR